MDASELIAYVQNGIDDPGVLSTDILAAINKNLKRFTAMVKIPDLIDEYGDVVIFPANSNYINMPSNYEPAHGILYAYSQTNSAELEVRVNSKVLYRDRDRTDAGTITEVAADGTVLYCYQKTSAKDSVLLRFYEKPCDLVYDSTHDDSPTYIPSDLHEPLLGDGTVVDLLKFKRYMESEAAAKVRDEEIKREALARLTAGLAELKERFSEPAKPKLNPRRLVRTF